MRWEDICDVFATVALNLGWHLQAKRYNQATNWGEKIYYLQQKECWGIFSKAVFQNSKIGNFYAKDTCNTKEGAWAEENSA